MMPPFPMQPARPNPPPYPPIQHPQARPNPSPAVAIPIPANVKQAKKKAEPETFRPSSPLLEAVQETMKGMFTLYMKTSSLGSDTFDEEAVTEGRRAVVAEEPRKQAKSAERPPPRSILRNPPDPLMLEAAS